MPTLMGVRWCLIVGFDLHFPNTVAWKIPWTEEPGGLQSMGSLRVGHDWVTSLSPFTFIHWRRKWQPTPVFLPGESQGQGSLVGCCLWGHRVRHDWSDLAVAAAAILMMLNIFSCVCWPSVCILGKNIYSGPLPLFNWVVFIFCWAIWVICICWILTPNQIYDLQIILSHSVGCLFRFVNSFFHCAKTFKFDIVP